MFIRLATQDENDVDRSASAGTACLPPVAPCDDALVAVAAGILSPTLTLRFWATETRTRRFTPASVVAFLAGEDADVDTLPRSPWGRRSEESLTSRAFSPKIARSRRSSAVSSVSPLG